MPEETPLTHTRGDTLILPLICFSDGLVMDITGFSIKFSVKSDIRQSTYIIEKVVAITDGPKGECLLTISAEETSNLGLGTYYYDIQITDGVGEVFTPVKGPFTITYDITR